MQYFSPTFIQKIVFYEEIHELCEHFKEVMQRRSASEKIKEMDL